MIHYQPSWECYQTSPVEFAALERFDLGILKYIKNLLEQLEYNSNFFPLQRVQSQQDLEFQNLLD